VTERLRDVRPTRQFYADLHRQLPARRGEDGTPSRVDFELYDLVDILDTFARGWDQLPPMFRGRSDYRVLISSGMLVTGYSVQAVMARDGAIELLSLGLDLQPLDVPPDNDELE
jgi:hypothetical protein